MKNMNSSLRSQFETLKTGEHLCSIYLDMEDQLAAVIPYITIGLERNEKVLYVVDERTKEEISKALIAANIEINKYINSGQLIFLTKEDAYLKDGYFDPERMVNLLKQSQELALKEGFRALRVTGEMTWVFTKLPGVERLIEYEAMLNYFLPTSKTLALCQYNEARFSPETLISMLYTHRKIVYCGLICNNPYYLPPDDFLGKKVDEISRKLYEKVRDQIIERKRLETEQQEASREAVQLVSFSELSPNPIIELDFSGKVYFINSAAKAIFPDLQSTGLRHPFLSDLSWIISSFQNKEKSSFMREIILEDKCFLQNIHYIPESQHIRIYAVDVSRGKQAEDKLLIANEEIKKDLERIAQMSLSASENKELIMGLKKEVERMKAQQEGK